MCDLVSIIIPTFNRANTISRAIRSILAQNFSAIEIIIVDDCSLDNTEEVVNTFADEKIRYIKLEKNGGASRARNKGVQEAKGNLIAFLDSDDEWLMDMLNKQLSILELNPDCDAVIAGFIRYYKGIPEYISAPQSMVSSEYLISELIIRNFVSAQSLMLKKSCFLALGGFDENLSHYEDKDFGIRLLQNFKVITLNIPLAIVYETPGNLTSMTVQKTVCLEKFLTKHHQTILAYNKTASVRHYWFLGHSYMLSGDKEKGRKYINDSLRISFTFKSLISLILSFFGANYYRITVNITHKMLKNGIE